MNLHFLRNGSCSLPADYEQRTSIAKRDYLWQQIMATKYDRLPNLNQLGLCRLIKSGLALVSLQKSFTHTSDEMPFWRIKAIHPFGSVAQVEFVSESNHPYTGIFKQGIGLARLSLAGPPLVIGVTPGMAIKFFLTGRPSVNVHVMNSLDGQGDDCNFFARSFTNNLPAPQRCSSRLLERWFALFKEDPRYLPVDHLAKYTQDGSIVQKPVAPFELIWVPGDDTPKAKAGDFRVVLATIPPGTVLYTLWAKASPRDRATYVGKLTTASKFVASAYGDEELFFKHHR